MQIAVNADCRSSRVFIIRNKGTKEPKSPSQHLNSLKILVLSMYLETKMLLASKSVWEYFEFEFSVPFWRNQIQQGAWCSKFYIASLRKGKATSIPSCSMLQYLRLCLKSILSPTGTAKIWKHRIWQKDQQENKVIGLTCKHVTTLNGNDVKHVRSSSSADRVSCTKKDWLHRGHKAEKRRQDRVWY